MNSLLRHIAYIVSTVCLVSLPSGCRHDADNVDNPLPDNGTAMLVLSTSLLEQSRAEGTTEQPEVEKMHTLRIVILHEDGSVEHNQFIDFNNSPQAECIRIFNVRQDETKKIYLIANEQSVSGSFHENLESFTGTGFRNTVDDLSFIPDYTKPIPMCSVYDITVNAEPRQEHTLYLVRAATKFTLRFTSERMTPVVIDSIDISAIASKTYLVPHKKNLLMDFTDFDSGETESLFWIDWLKRVSDESQANPSDKTLADKRGWIQDYDIPEGQAQKTVSIKTPEKFEIPGLSYPATGAPIQGKKNFPAFYLPESKNLKDTSGNGYGEQAYAMKLHLTANDEKKTFTCTFDNLKALFRNTHVLVDITLWEKGIDVDVRPYSEVVLEPDFGI